MLQVLWILTKERELNVSINFKKLYKNVSIYISKFNKLFIICFFLNAFLFSFGYAGESDKAIFVQGTGKFWHLKGESKGFDKNNKYVKFKKTKNKNKYLMIYAHGGGGMTSADEKRVKLFEGFGFDIISFDAFKMNEIDANWANRNLSDATKQELVRNVLIGALLDTQQNYEKIVLFGQSNGARVAVALLGELNVEAKKKVKLVISEAPASGGLSLPNRVEVPIYFFVGSIDNWGGLKGDADLLWTRYSHPDGSNDEWYNKQVRIGAPVHLVTYLGAGHSFHAGEVRAVTRKMAGSKVMTGYLGAPSKVIAQYESDLKKLALSLK